MVALKQGYDLAEEVRRLKEERNAVILAHNYQVPEIQDLADYVGDSLGLSYRAKETGADVIVFCGVHFMAETAKIVNPGKTVILPDLEAGCSLSESCPADKLEAFLRQNAAKNYYVIAYINCSAGVKALSDVICTSGNAVKIVESAPADRNLLFVPDQNLGAWVRERTANGSLAGRLLRSCGIHSEQHQRNSRRISGCSRRSTPGVHLRGPNASRRDLFDRKDGQLLPRLEGKQVYHCDRVRHAPPVKKRDSRKDLYSGADRQLRLRKLPIYEEEHPGETSRRAGDSAA
jgi:hypothetical protein